MEYKDEFTAKVKDYFKDSVIAAEKINAVWEQIESYFNDLGDSLEIEIDLLGNYVEYYNDGNVIEFAIRDVGIRLEKSVFTINLQKLTGEEYTYWKYFEYKDGKIVNFSGGDEYNDSSLNSWLRELKFDAVLI